jgi:hypothetical protein
MEHRVEGTHDHHPHRAAEKGVQENPPAHGGRLKLLIASVIMVRKA